MSPSAPLLQVLDLAFGVAGFLIAYLLYNVSFPGTETFNAVAPGLAISILTFWFCTERQETDPADVWVIFIEQMSLSTGLNLIIQALLTYFLIYQHIPLFLIFVGGLVSSGLLVTSRKWMEIHLPESRQGVLMLGFDPHAYSLLKSLRQPVVGMLELPSDTIPPAEIPVLGGAERLAQVVAEKHPSRILVAGQDWHAQAYAETLLECRLSGILVNDIPSLDEKLRHRISAERFGPADFLLSPALTSNRRAMAVQAIYTNLFGLLLLLLSLPLMAVIATAVLLFSGRGPVLESVECLGFQNIPFQRFRFRTRGRRGVTTVGRLISRLHLQHLPQLINVVRGEMALVGPQPARTVFAERLTELMPFYSHRFTVKPGIIGWARLHLGSGILPGETVRIEYDLYYVKEGSPALDLEVLARYLFGRVKARRTEAVER